MTRHLVAYLLAYFWYSVTFAQSADQYKFSRIDNRQGLSHNSAKCFFKDKKGFMWIGTQSGLNRFDGYQFKVFSHNSSDSTSILDNQINHLIDDGRGRIIVKCDFNYDIFDPATESFDHNWKRYLSTLHIPDVVVVNVKNIANRYLYFITLNQGVYEYNLQSGKTKLYGNGKGDCSLLYSNSVSDLNIDTKGNFWMVYNNGVLDKIGGEPLKLLARNYDLYRKWGDEQRYDLMIDSLGNAWVCIPSVLRGAYCFNSNADLIDEASPNSLRWKTQSWGINSMIQNSNGDIWLGADPGGITIIKPGKYGSLSVLNALDDKTSISQNSITSLFRENENIIWVGTYKQGVNYYNDKMFKFRLMCNRLSDPTGLPFQDVDCFVEDKNGNMWIGTNGGGIIYWDRKKNSFRQYKNNPKDPNSLSGDVVLSLYLDKHDRLWIGTYMSGLNCFDGKRFIRYKHDKNREQSIADDRVWAIMEDSKHHIWLAYMGGGVDIMDAEKGTFSRLNTESKKLVFNDWVLSLAEEKNGDVWVGTCDGIDVVNLEAKTTHHHWITNHPGTNNINCILRDSHGFMWVGTRNGIGVFDYSSKYFRLFYEKDGLTNNYVISLQEDNFGNIWAATANGVSCITPIKEKWGRYSFHFQNYDEADGLQGKEFNLNSSYKTRNGEILFGGGNGFNIFSPQEVKRNQNVPPIVFTNLEIYYESVGINKKINGRMVLSKSISYTDEISLTHKDKIFSIEFAALSYIQPEKNSYKYMLEGFDKDWVTTNSKNRKVTYTNLDPGRYVFKVQAANNDGVWNKKGISLVINVQPAWWATIGFKIFLLVIISTVIVAFFKFRIAVYKRIQEELGKLVEARTRELVEANDILLERQARIEEQAEELQVNVENVKAANELLLDKNRLIRIQAEALEDTNKQLSVLNSTKDRLFSIIAHDLKNPFHVVGGFSDLMLKEFDLLTEDQKKEYLGIISESSKGGNELLDNLLQWSRSQTGRIRFTPMKENLRLLVESNLSYLSGSAISKGVRIVNAVNPLLYVNADANMIKTVLRNLISNAIKFTASGGSIKISSSQDGEFVEIVVTDSGVGIPKENIGLLFRIETNITTAGTSNEAGTGLGLILCHDFVAKHGGKIWVESEVGQGSSFKFTLPLA